MNSARVADEAELQDMRTRSSAGGRPRRKQFDDFDDDEPAALERLVELLERLSCLSLLAPHRQLQLEARARFVELPPPSRLFCSHL